MQAPEDTWITVYGFQSGDQQLVLREFAKCGDILHFGSGREDKVNWVHIQYAVSNLPLYMELWSMADLAHDVPWLIAGERTLSQLLLLQNNYQAQRALLKNGQTVGGKLMIGVKPLEDRHRAAAENLSGSGSKMQRHVKKSMVVRPYKLDGPTSQVICCTPWQIPEDL